MKTIIALLFTVALASSAAVNLITSAGTTTSVEITTNSANSSLVDVAWNLDLPDTVPTDDDIVNPTACFKASDSNFTIADTATGLSVFSIKWTCTATTGLCADLAAHDNAFEQASGSAGTSTSGVYGTGALVANTGTFAPTSNATTNVITRTISAVSPTEITSAGLPNMTETFYFKCYGLYNAATATDFVTGEATASTDLTATANITLSGSSSSVAAILAVAGSLAASFAF